MAHLFVGLYPGSYDAYVVSSDAYVVSPDAYFPLPEDPPPYTKKPAVDVKALKRKRSSTPSSASPNRIRKLVHACPNYVSYLRALLRAWVCKQRKPYSAITVQIDRLTSEQYDENDLGGLVDLLEVIKLQASGPTEAARVLRKKLKYGTPHRQLRALNIIDGLLANGGQRFQRSFLDEPLMERLRLLARDEMVDQDVKKKVNILFRQWASEYKNTPGLERLTTLAQQLPKTRKPQPAQSRVIRETEAEAARDDDDDDDPSPPRAPAPGPASRGHSRNNSRNLAPSSTIVMPPGLNSPLILGAGSNKSSNQEFSFLPKRHKDKDKKKANKAAEPFDLQKEKPQLLQTIAQANIASSNLLNALKRINRETHRVSQDPDSVQGFEECKAYRRRILRYIQLVESEQYIGSLLNANDQLVTALMAFEVMDKSIDDDSDSDAGEYVEHPETHGRTSTEHALAGLSLSEAAPPAKPPRPGALAMPTGELKGKEPVRAEEPEEEVDEDDPFSDRNAVKTPFVEKGGMTW